MEKLQPFNNFYHSNFTPKINPSFQKTLPFEFFDYVYWTNFAESHQLLPLIVASGYLLLVFSLQHWMKDRPAYDLRLPLIWWNFGLSLFSAIAFVRVFPSLFNALTKPGGGLYAATCDRDTMTMTEMYWLFLGGVSKVFEFGDTIFIVLRKRPLIRLHWFHHAATSALVFQQLPHWNVGARWGVVINMGIHAVMYCYYGLKAKGINIPKRVAKIITRMQILQLVAFLVFTNIHIHSLLVGKECSNNNQDVSICAAFEVSLLVLFVRYYVKTYMSNKVKNQ